MRIAIHGLGRMGMQLAKKLLDDGHEVIAHNRSEEPQLLEAAASYGATAAPTKDDVVSQFGDQPALVWVMLPSEFTDDEIAEWTAMLRPGSIIINGGNSDFRKTKALSQLVLSAGMVLVDIGVSGGVWGYEFGFPLMVGCDNPHSVKEIEPVLDSLIKPGGAWHYFGESGTGHYTKMIHNAIEYGIMQSLAEGYRLMREGPYKNIDLAAAGNVWEHHSVISSWLNDLTRQALAEDPELSRVAGSVAESGEARWALEVAKEHQIDMPAIRASFDVRLRSQKGDTNFATKIVSVQRHKFGGHADDLKSNDDTDKITFRNSEKNSHA